MELRQEPHPLLCLRWFEAEVPAPVSSPDWLVALLKADAPAPLLPPDDGLRGAVRDLLRHGGFKPTGRSKPASEYLAKAAVEPGLASINPVVDLGNVVSLKSGFPISVVDLGRTDGALRVGLAGAGEKYLFNASGQEIDLSGLLCLFDEQGPCANAVKDAQRTKTNAETRRTLSLIWGVVGYERQVDAARDWYRELLSRL